MRLIIVSILFFAAPLSACIWDYDTLAEESADKPDVKTVIVGGFARNPAQYYELRLKRLHKLIAANPDDLDAYDGAAVACDRLGRYDEAIDWMAKKNEAMDRIGYAETEQPNHRYRYLANLGTFHAHLWFHNGADHEQVDDLRSARELVALAIEENPDAHFGREKYQLMFIEWLLGGPRVATNEADAEQLGQWEGWLPNVLGIGQDGSVPMRVSDNNDLAEMGIRDAVDGITGLIRLGAAWESVDAFFALALALQTDGKSSFAHFAMLRVEELLNTGKTSVVTGMTEDQLRADDLLHIGYGLSKTPKATIEEYEMLRRQANDWHERRTNYMVSKLDAGQHPDTHTDFWSGFEGNPDRMEVPSGMIYKAGGFWRAVWTSDWFWILSIFVIGSALISAYYFYAKRRDLGRRKDRYAI